MTMLLLPCPACRKKVSEIADTCPKCGHPLAADAKFQAIREAMHKPAGPAGALVAFILLGIVIVWCFNRILDTGPSTGSSTNGTRSAVTRSATDGDVHGAWAYVQLFVEKRLKSPSSADFPFGGYRHVTSLGGGRYKFDSYVDAENAFGAKLRTHFEGIIKKVQSGWQLEDLQFKG